MKISTRGRYALRLMLDIASYEAEGPVRIRDVAQRQELSVKYLESIVSILVKAGFVKSIRGPQGGYRLMKPPADYTAGMILRLTEGSLVPVSCLEDEINQCGRAGYCVTLRLWKELDEAIRNVVDGYTLEDLMRWERDGRNDYVI